MSPRRRAAVLSLLGAALAAAGSVAFAQPVDAPLTVRIEQPLGGQTSERVVTVQGTATGDEDGRVTLVLNGVAVSVGVENGRFSLPQVLAPGPNSVRVVAARGASVAEDEVALHAQVPAKDLRVTLTWDTPGTDVDLWVRGPDGEQVLYSHREGKAGGVLDTDVTSGFGPETYTQARLQRGTYVIEANAYRIDRPTRVEVTTIRFEGTPDEERRVFRAVLLRTKDTVVVGEFISR
jgi:uncharacterized protein YfaP (DUF2135 family)